MPRFLRVILTVLGFSVFFGGSVLLGILFFPLMLPFALFDMQRVRDRATRFVAIGYGTFLFWMKLMRLLDYERPVPPPGLEGRSYVVIANHPTLIDVIYLLNRFPGLTSVVKGVWYRSLVFGAVLRWTHYLPNDAGDDHEAVLDTMVDHLERGHPLVIFPEGTRSGARKLRRFKRGAFEAAIRAGVPIVPVFIRVSHPFLMKGQKILDLPQARVRYDFEVLPMIDTAGKDGRVLRNETQAMFRERWEQWVTERESASESGAPVFAEAAE